MMKKGFSMKKVFFSLFLLCVLNLEAFSFSIGELYLFKASSNQFLLGFNLKAFPLQEVILALKRQKEEVILLTEIELYRKRLLLRDERVEKYVFFKKAGYNLEKNQYYLEADKTQIFFNHPEDLANFLVNFESLSLFVPPLKREEDYYLQIRVELKFYTHLDPALRYTPKVRKMIYKTEKRYDFPKSLLY